MLQPRGKVERLVVKRGDRAAVPSVEARQGGVGRAVGLGVDEVDDGLRLAIVHAPVEKRALGELAAPRKARARRKAGLEDAARGDRAAVALELDDVLACVAAGRTKRKHDRLVDRHSAAGRVAHSAKREAPRAGGGPARDARRDLESILAGHPDHGHARAPRGRRDRGDSPLHQAQSILSSMKQYL